MKITRLTGYLLHKMSSDTQLISISQQSSYYIKHRCGLTIRISKHDLHPKQVRYKYIYVNIADEKFITVNDKLVPYDPSLGKLRKKIRQRIMFEIYLFHLSLK